MRQKGKRELREEAFGGWRVGAGEAGTESAEEAERHGQGQEGR